MNFEKGYQKRLYDLRIDNNYRQEKVENDILIEVIIDEYNKAKHKKNQRR